MTRRILGDGKLAIMEFQTETKPHLLYWSTSDEFADLVSSVTPRQLATEVPLCPGWSVKDVAAHVCGVAADFLADRLEGVGSDDWTARQVQERAEATVADVCEEWMSYRTRLEDAFIADSFVAVRLLGDLVVHLHDVQHALEVVPDRSDEPTRLSAYRQTVLLQERALERCDVDVSIEFPDDSFWRAGEASASSTRAHVTLSASPFDFLRTVTGRRGLDEARSLNWRCDVGQSTEGGGCEPGSIIETVIETALVTYGSLRATDVGF